MELLQEEDQMRQSALVQHRAVVMGQYLICRCEDGMSWHGDTENRTECRMSHFGK